MRGPKLFLLGLALVLATVTLAAQQGTWVFQNNGQALLTAVPSGSSAVTIAQLNAQGTGLSIFGGGLSSCAGGCAGVPSSMVAIRNTTTAAVNPGLVMLYFQQATDSYFAIGGNNTTFSANENVGWGLWQGNDGTFFWGVGATNCGMLSSARTIQCTSALLSDHYFGDGSNYRIKWDTTAAAIRNSGDTAYGDWKIDRLRSGQTTAPTCSASCGTTPSVSGTDTAMLVTMGATGTPASPFTVTFNQAWATAPSCTANAAKTGMAAGKAPILVVPGTASVVITTNGTAPSTGDVYAITCIGVS